MMNANANSNAIAFLFSFFPSCCCFWMDLLFFACILSFIRQNGVTRIRLMSLTHWQMFSSRLYFNSYILYVRTCSLEEIVRGGYKRTRSQGKLKPLYLHWYSVYAHKTWYDVDLPWGTSTLKVIWPFDLVVSQDRVTKVNHFISTTIVSKTTKPDRLVTYIEGFLYT